MPVCTIHAERQPSDPAVRLPTEATLVTVGQMTSVTSILGGRRLLRTKMANGCRVVVLESRAAPVVAIQVWVGVGAADETEEQAGLAHVHEHMLFKGTSHNGIVGRGVGQVAAEIESSGGEINAFTTYDHTVYHVVIAKQFFDVGLDVLSDAVLHSAFDPGELSRELEVIIEEIKRSEDTPSSRVNRALFSTAFEQHPYRRPVIGYRSVVEKLTRDDVLSFFDAHYRADRMTVVIVGDIDAEVALDKVQEAFSEARPGAKRLPVRPVEPRQEGLRARGLVDDIEEAHLAIGFRGRALLDGDTPTLDILSVLLGQGDSSRLSRRIKRDLHLVNAAWAYAYTPKDPGLFVVGATLHHDKLHEALAALGAELVRVKEGVTPAEMQKARALLASDAIYQRETVEGLARRLGTWTLLTDDPGFEASYQARVAAVTADDVREVAARIIDERSATVVALAPRAQESLVDASKLMDIARQALSPPRRRTTLMQDRVTRVALPNGARVIVEHDAANPIVTMRAVWLGGLRAENDDTAGYTNLCADLVNKGTARLSAVEIAENLDATASGLDGFAGRNSFGLRATFLTPHARGGYELFFECMRDAAFLETELDRQKLHTLEDLRARADNPAGLCFDLFHKSLWRTHPYRRDLLGTPESVRAATSDRLRSFWQSRAKAGGAVLSFVGDVDPDEICELVAAALPAADAAVPPSPGLEQDPPARVARLVRERAQAHLVTGVRGLSLDDGDRFALEILTSTLSGQGGRLFLELRDRQSLCYSVNSFSVEGIEPGSFAVYMGTSPDKVDRAFAGINALLDAIAQDGITQAELDRARRYLTGSHAIGLQRLGSRGTAMALNDLYGLGHLAHTHYVERISAVVLADVRRVAQHILSRARVTAVVGPEGTGGPPAT